MGLPKIVISVAADTAAAVRDVKNLDSALGGAQTRSEKWGSALSSASKVATGVLVGAAGAAVLMAGKAEESASATARLAQTLGNVKGVDQAAIDRQQDLARAISKTAGVADEEIKAGQAILATFQAVGATAGETGGAFDRATQAAVDLAAAGFGSVTDNSKQLGKALQDPLKGIGALRKAGVDFTAAQQEQIKTMVEAGDVAGAQAIILSNVEMQVGGTAAATADASDKMKVAWDDAAAALGEALLPVMETAAGKIQDLSGWVEENKTAVTAAGVAVVGLAGAVVLVNAAVKVYTATKTVATAAQKVWTAVTNAGTAAAIRSKAATIASTAVTVAQRVALLAGAAAMAVVRGAVIAWTAVQWALNAALLANPIGLIIVGIAALAAGIYLAYKKFGPFRAIVDAVWQAIKTAVKWVGDLIGKLRNLKFPEPPAWLKSIGGAIGGIFGGRSLPAVYAAPAPAVAPFATRTGSAGGSSRPALRIDVVGVLDPVDQANAIRRALRDNDVRLGRVRFA